MASTAAEGFRKTTDAQLRSDLEMFMQDARPVERCLLRDIIMLWHANQPGEGEDGFTLAWAIDEVCGRAVDHSAPALPAA